MIRIAAPLNKRLTYTGARARLYSLEHWGIKLGLDNIRDFCAHLGNPQDRFASIHIAGTNGKGSTSAFLDSILRAAGYRVGRYTSPHLKDFRERIHIGGRPIPPSVVTGFIAAHWDRILAKRYSYFEVSTALAFDAFAKAKVDLAVVEVGLGGRFDATNVIDPLLSVITRIARDHEHVLGHTPEAIAFEKAGIIKSGVPVLIGPLFPGAESRIRQVADAECAPVFTSHEILSADASAGVLPALTDQWTAPLAGDHQLTNLATALAATRLLQPSAIDIDAGVIQRGINQVRWPARFQIQQGRPRIIYDAAHNPDGIRAIVKVWRAHFGSRRCVCIFNTRTDKNYKEMIEDLVPIVDDWIGCPLPGAPGISESEMRELVCRAGVRWHWAATPGKASAIAKSLAGSKGLVLMTGSHFLVGATIPTELLNRPSGVVTKINRLQLLAAAQDQGPAF